MTHLVCICLGSMTFMLRRSMSIFVLISKTGNTCGVAKNAHYPNFPLSGQDMSDRKYLYFFDLLNIKESLKICVKRCPKRNMNTSADLYNYFQETGYSYCRYDFDMSLLRVS